MKLTSVHETEDQAIKAFEELRFLDVCKAMALLLVDLDDITTGGTGAFIRYVSALAEYGISGKTDGIEALEMPLVVDGSRHNVMDNEEHESHECGSSH